ncbi:TIGR02530 family flagellar biosynthesis protein [Bacillus sp. JCM 19034]|uniref:TIGR02530 family flagellar biosynthesis protein n=1 Tax=Bacillus sp. JCM 19034 TaxID=1481928 RepID=UPI000784A888|nr:TIGR02530 family flagellar biosynthesis protein [Bacillus sp. JCM 19034]
MDPRVHLRSLAPLPSSPVKNVKNINREKSNFKNVFQSELDNFQKLIITKHAKSRIESRNILIDDKKWLEIEQKMTEAKEKGLKESVVITDEATLLVNAQTHTVITALLRSEAKDQIFSNINGTILID